jgi:hypothetical protein
MPKTNPASMSIAKILGLLTPGQAWSILAATLAVVAGTFTLGLKVANYRTERLADRLDALTHEMGAQQTRTEFFTRYTKFLIARQMEYEQHGCIAEVNRSYEPAQSLADLIAPWYYQRLSTATFDQGATPTVTKGFSGAQDSHVTFADHGDSWPIPGLVKGFVLDRKK